MGFYDAFPVPMMGPADAIRLLRTRFPELYHLLGNPDNLDHENSEPYYSYGIFSREVWQRRNDKSFLDRVCSLINEMVVSREHILEDLASVGVLEELAADPVMAEALYSNLVPEAQKALRAIECEFYGRPAQG
jgi:hypothetical protein